MANKKNLYIPKIDDNDRNTAYNRNKSSNSPFEKFASSYSGYNVTIYLRSKESIKRCKKKLEIVKDVVWFWKHRKIIE